MAGRQRARTYIFALTLTLASAIAGAHFWPWGSEQFLWEYGPLQIFQSLVLLSAAVVVWRGLRSQSPDSDERPVLAAMFWLLVVLFWRELELDYSLTGVLLGSGTHAFSWTYLYRGPLWKILVFGVPSLLFTGWALRIIIPKLSRTLRLALARIHLPSPRLLALGLATLAVSQLWDKPWFSRTLGLGAFSSDARDPLPEELLEICGELFLLMCAIEFVQEVRSRARAHDVSGAADEPLPTNDERLGGAAADGAVASR